MIVIIFSLEKFNQNIYECHMKIQSDHKPLESMLNKSLACTPTCFQGMMIGNMIARYSMSVARTCTWPIHSYFSMRDEFSVHDGVILHGQQIVVSVSPRKGMKQKLHASHLGTESCLRRASQTIFRPNMNTELKEMIATCETCRKYETSHQKESLRSWGTQSTLGASSSRPLWAQQERVRDHSRLLQQFLGDCPPHKYHLISWSFEAEQSFCPLWLP